MKLGCCEVMFFIALGAFPGVLQRGGSGVFAKQIAAQGEASPCQKITLS